MKEKQLLLKYPCKKNNVEMAIKVAREARQVLGGMGITGGLPNYEAHDES